jgi:hypothetical protein
VALHFYHYPPSLLVAIPVASVTLSHKSEINAVPTPGSKAVLVLAGDSRRGHALITLLDVLGLTTNGVPLAVGTYFGLRCVSCQRAKDRCCRWPRPSNDQ